eukprot:CAMPEP_0115288914 /NCGR_PEP_ID=MMETSP0270-20121206/63225_1 /TAXON_ID=71861 /ORGANISM="Scrippsiella trochoidea, Strain CCMP3099" /LENGTH=305 /DNA_ID=CAMNT_0002706049 /DNA_START=535 /DNA_END=1453 /DNA_ORIENTATION=-
MITPIRLNLECMHSPLSKPASERALAHIAHEQIELQRRGVPEVPNLEPHRPVHRASRHSVLILTFHLLAFSAAHAPSPRLTWCEVQAHVWNLPNLSGGETRANPAQVFNLENTRWMHHSTHCGEESATRAVEIGVDISAGCGSPGGGRNAGKDRPGGASTSMCSEQDSPGGSEVYDSSFDGKAESRRGPKPAPDDNTKGATALSGEDDCPSGVLNGMPVGDEAALVLGVALPKLVSVRRSSNRKLQGTADCAASGPTFPAACLSRRLCANASWQAAAEDGTWEWQPRAIGAHCAASAAAEVNSAV